MGIINRVEIPWEVAPEPVVEEKPVDEEAVRARIQYAERLLFQSTDTIRRQLRKEGAQVRGPLKKEKVMALSGDSSATVTETPTALTVNITGGMYHNASHLSVDLVGNHVHQYAVFRPDGTRATAYGMGWNAKDTRELSYEDALRQANIVLEDIAMDI